jgi:hypothetical protein
MLTQQEEGREPYKYDVFLSHAGSQKRNFACWLDEHLKWNGVKCFFDERSLVGGNKAPEVMIEAVAQSKIVIVVLTEEYVQRKWPMMELKLAMERYKRGECTVIPLFYALSPDEVGNPWEEPVARALQKQSPETLRQCISDLQAVAKVTGHRRERGDGWVSMIYIVS